MPFIRPELKERFPFLRQNWFEIVSALILTWLGGSIAWRGIQYESWVNTLIGGIFLVFAGLFLLVTYRAAQIRRAPDAPGIVEVMERQITYLAPKDGGIVNLDDLQKLEILIASQDTEAPVVYWVFWLEGEPTIMIPNNANGSAGIFDAISGLPGVSTPKVIAAMGSTENARVTIWESREPIAH